MVIISQDKNMIINFNSIVSVYVIKNYISEEESYKGYNIDFATNEEINFVLATYNTEERAKEVLQEIVKQKSIFEYFKNVPERTQNLIAKDFTEDNKIFDIYEMPEK